jgi:hypothetical protein
MKRLILLAGLPLFLFADTQSQTLKWVDEQIIAIKPGRPGMDNGATAVLKNPFYVALRLNQTPAKENGKKKVSAPAKIIKEVEVVSSHPHLQAIVNRSSVLIDGNWYRKNDKVHEYTIKEIDESTVVLQSRKKELKLFIAASDSKIKIQTK